MLARHHAHFYAMFDSNAATIGWASARHGSGASSVKAEIRQAPNFSAC